jgi:predicted Zn-dependent protease
MTRRAALLLGAVGSLGAGSLAFPEAASADHFSGATGSRADCSANWAGDINQTDNSGWYWAYVSLNSATQSALEWAKTNIFNPTDFNVTIEAEKSQTDMVARDLDYTTYCGVAWDGSTRNVWGLTTCVTLTSWNGCDKHEVRYDEPDVLYMQLDHRRGLACHETGHAAGLRHRDNPNNVESLRGCMYTEGPYKNFLSPHDRDMINNNY